MIRFAIIVFCFFLAFHLIAYYALIRAMFKDAKGKIIAGICVVVHFLITAGFAAVLLIFRADIPHFLYATLSTTALNAVLFFTFGIINIVFLIAFRRKIQRQILTSRILFGVSVLCIIFAIFNANYDLSAKFTARIDNPNDERFAFIAPYFYEKSGENY